MTVLSDTPPPSDSSQIALVQQSPEEKVSIWRMNGESWRGPLSLEQYIGRETPVGNQKLTREGGVVYWLLTDKSQPPNARPILSSCESYRKSALVKHPGKEVENVVSYGIGSVFCDPKFRGKGYARRMMDEVKLAISDKEGQEPDFTVLYSDVGKHFYAKSGWKPFTSSHIPLPPATAGRLDTDPESRLLYAEDLEELCQQDELMLREEMRQLAQSADEILVALVPDVATMSWLHAREEYIGQELRRQAAKVKGALVYSEGKRVWCIWSRFFGDSTLEGNILHILRIVVEGQIAEASVQTSGCLEPASSTDSENAHVGAIAKLLRAAQHQAADLSLNQVQMWNPSQSIIAAAKELAPSTSVVQHDEESIASLRWSTQGEVKSRIKWLANEKYGWC